MTARVICGDSRDYICALRRGSFFPVIVTDPPFNVGYHYADYADNLAEAEYFAFLAEVLGFCPSVVVHYPEAISRLSIAIGKPPRRVVSWVYNSNTARQHRDIAYFGIEPCFDGLGEYKNPTDKRIKARMERGLRARGYDWLYCDQVKNVTKGVDAHPCQMPLQVMLYILATLPRCATIIDPFAGSGTTLLAAQRLKMRAVGVEMSRNYCEIARARLAADSPLFDYVEGLGS